MIACRISGHDASTTHLTPPKRAVRLALLGFFILAVLGAHKAHAANARRQIEVQNHTAEPVRVFVSYHSILPSGQWGWFNTDDTTTWVLLPGERTTLVDRGFTINGDIARIRARGENSGRQWDWGEQFIGANSRGPSRVIGKTLLTVWSEEGLPLFSDRHTRRSLAVKNSTSKTIVVCVVYHTREADGEWEWKNPGCRTHWTLKPGDHSNLLHDGEKVTANAVRISARDQARKLIWADHRDEAIFIGDYEGSGGYQGSYTYTFSDSRSRPFEPLALRSLSISPKTITAGRSVEVVMEYALEDLSASGPQPVTEEQRIELKGSVVGRFKKKVQRSPGTYRAKRTVDIPLVASSGTYTVVGTVRMGRHVKSFLGVHIQSVTPELSEEFGLDGASGAVVMKVKEGSPAASSDLRRGDLIVAFNGQPVKKHAELLNYVGASDPGSEVALKVMRDGAEKTIKVTLGRPSPNAPKHKVATKKVSLRVKAP